MSEDLRSRYQKLLDGNESMIEASENVEGSLADTLSRLMADVVSFYFRAHGAHWNVVGPDFTEYHDLFGEIAADVYDSFDPLAENIRKLSGFPPVRLSQFMSMRELDDGVGHTDALMLARDLHDTNLQVLDCITEAFVQANAMNEQGIANFLAERDDMHKKWGWQLRAHLGIA